MSTQLTHTMTYDAPLAAVSAMLDDPAYRHEVIVAQGCTDGSFTIETAGDVTTAVVDQVRPAAGLPSYATRLVGSEINIVQREEWTSAEYADLHVSIPGKPGQMVGSNTLVEDGTTTTETLEVAISVSIPLVGGKVEKLIADMLRKALREEERVAHAYLSR
ncbi:DUF2505 domain-containing protein [Nocardioides sp. URHA0020]|uniref:DUF2505 domain-containing protein n=1 Tax=Nocardioides sp. URHA0020 TaxID=1380392 RepID=UPI00048CDF9D|nr:DUF2505 domain-containing protein [Nocardioides sp. URHA0020]